MNYEEMGLIYGVSREGATLYKLNVTMEWS